jgi:hypothetical protein
MQTAPAISLSSKQRTTLEQWTRSRSLPARVIERTRIVLLIAASQQVARWRGRFLTLGLEGMKRNVPRGLIADKGGILNAYLRPKKRLGLSTVMVRISRCRSV